VSAAVPVSVSAAVPVSVGAVVLDRAEVAARIRGVYAQVLEYPEEVFEDLAELEADLGVDSVKQTELFGRVAETFGMGIRPDGLRVADYPTFGAVVDFMHGALHSEVRV
jgi:[acyl-carrier-protein] S-malonyltransferase